ncbi:hypothetical protein DSM112329_04958 [Paraconexibacter sp. AEG42_29]|uniref:Uncharacterized protein n=1 Tax=Paraconexibacter sp. AEG42_29 TaxID=2997339 RepID=A0AAU7B378_9ACTN
MRSFLLAAGAALLTAATLPGAAMAAATATPEIPLGIQFDPLECVQTVVDTSGAGAVFSVQSRGTIDLDTLEDADFNRTAAQYTFDPPVGAEEPGTWAWSGRVTFPSGPLSAASGYSLLGTAPAKPVAMPHDPNRSRTFPLVLASTATPSVAGAPPIAEGGDSYWYCGAKGYEPAKLVGAKAIAKLKAVSKIPVTLPGFFRPTQQTPNNRTGLTAQTKTLKRGTWRVQLSSSPCGRGNSCSAVVFAAHRLGPKEKRYTATPVTLAGGIRGTQNSVGCGFDPKPSWAPYYCGQRIVTWVRKGVEYAVQMNSSEPDFQELIRYANAMIRGR